MCRPIWAHALLSDEDRPLAIEVLVRVVQVLPLREGNELAVHLEKHGERAKDTI